MLPERSSPSPSGAAKPTRAWRRPALPASSPASNWRSRTGFENSAITPPEALPYSAENGPRSTSTRSAPARSKCATWPWPSGMVAGMPSAYRRRPRTPKPARAPKPRLLICRSCAWLLRLATTRPGTRAIDSDRFTIGPLSRSAASPTVVIA